MRELVGKKVKGKNHSATGFVVSQLPDFRSGIGIVLKVAWDVNSINEAQSLPESYLQDEHSSEIEIIN